MRDEAIAATHERAVEQVMSDEHLLGALPEDLSQTLLDWVIGRYDQAATDAANVEAFMSKADAIRYQARTIAAASAAAGDDAAALNARLRSAEAAADRAGLQPDGVGQPVPPTAASVPDIEREVPESTPAPPLPPHSTLTNGDALLPDERIARPRGPGAVPKRAARLPNITLVWMSLRRAYDRFRALLRGGGGR